MQGGVLSEDIVQPAMLRGPLAAGAARARRRPAHSFPVKKQQNISVIKTERPRQSSSGVATEAGPMMFCMHARTPAGDGVDALREYAYSVQCASFALSAMYGDRSDFLLVYL